MLSASVVVCVFLAAILIQPQPISPDVKEPFDLVEIQSNDGVAVGDVTQNFQQLWTRFKEPTDDEFQLIMNIHNQGLTGKYETLRPWLNDNEPILAELRELSSHGKTTFLNVDLIRTTNRLKKLFLIHAFQGFQFLLGVKAYACLADGDIDSSWEWMKVTLRIGRLVSRHKRGTKSVFGHSVDQEFHATVFEILRRWTSDDRTTVEHLKISLEGLIEDQRPQPLKSGRVHSVSAHEIELNRQIAGERAARLMVACQLFHRLHGRFPPSLTDLVPDILSELPEDPFRKDRRTLKYYESGTDAVVYSLGADRTDGGGEVYGETQSDIGQRFSAMNHPK